MRILPYFTLLCLVCYKYRCIIQVQTILCSTGDSTCVYDEQGSIIDNAKADELFELVWSTISDAFSHSNEFCFTIPSNTSLKDYLVDKFSPSDLKEDDKKLVYQMAEIWGSFIGDPLDKQSLNYFWLEECLDGGNVECRVQLCNVRIDGQKTMSPWQVLITRSSPVSRRRLSRTPRSISQPKLMP